MSRSAPSLNVLRDKFHSRKLSERRRRNPVSKFPSRAKQDLVSTLRIPVRMPCLVAGSSESESSQASLFTRISSSMLWIPGEPRETLGFAAEEPETTLTRSDLCREHDDSSLLGSPCFLLRNEISEVSFLAICRSLNLQLAAN